MSYYDTLGVDRNADADTIKRAYRKLAAQHHPDRGGDTAKFQELQSAYETLSDPQKKAQYDHQPGPGQQFNFHGAHNINDIFEQMFGGAGPFRQQQNFRPQTRMTLWVSLADVAAGERRMVSIGTHGGVSMVEIAIPIGIDDGATVQYGGIAPGGGDLLVTFKIHPHPAWQRDGYHLTTEHTVSMWDCILGGETEIRDVLGQKITVTIPARCQPGTTLRLRGRGLRTRDQLAGDILVRVQARIPDNIPDELLSLISTLRG